MAFVNMFNDRVEQFNLREENERLAELFSDEKLQEEAQWQAYSVKEISRLFSISEEEALKLMNCGLFKTYRVGNEYRASKKSVEENKKIVKAVLTYQDKKTMSVPDVMRILGLGKTATYRLINQCRFKTYLVLGKMRVDVDSFEDWYAGQFHYEKVNGERPGKKYGKTLSPLTVAKVLGIPRSTANDLTGQRLTRCGISQLPSRKYNLQAEMERRRYEIGSRRLRTRPNGYGCRCLQPYNRRGQAI